MGADADEANVIEVSIEESDDAEGDVGLEVATAES